jgi:hypothetical protein
LKLQAVSLPKGQKYHQRKNNGMVRQLPKVIAKFVIRWIRNLLILV